MKEKVQPPGRLRPAPVSDERKAFAARRIEQVARASAFVGRVVVILRVVIAVVVAGGGRNRKSLTHDNDVILDELVDGERPRSTGGGYRIGDRRRRRRRRRQL